MKEKYTTEEIYEILKRRIIKLYYDPGQILNEQELAEEFSISRTPIRTVFQRLSYDELLTIIPRIGAQVPPVNYKKLKSVFELTRELDSLATKLAIDRISAENLARFDEILENLRHYKIENDYQSAIDLDQAFHDTVYEACGNKELQKILKKLHYQTERLWHHSEKYFDNMDLFIDSLTAIADAIKAGDKKRAELASKDHIDQFVEHIKSELL